ncbi:hypothetical protein BGZ49_005610, partial [Haplosporangium sp. Z 27]
TGEIVLTRKHNANNIGWMPDSQRFITGTNDGQMYIWNLQGVVVQEIDIGDNISLDKFCMIPGQNAAVIVTERSKIEIFSFDTEERRYVDSLAEKPTTMAFSPDGSYLALPLTSDPALCRPAQIFIYDFHSRTFMRTLEADSYVNDKFLIMPSFCGPNGEILCSGSEDGKLNFWDVESGELIMVLEEHTRHSGCTAVHPTMPGLLASCSDDNHIIL